jgi:hypothetical protein
MGENLPTSPIVLILGDLLCILLVTLTGFATHGEISAFPRMFSTFIPLCIGWGLAAATLGLYRSWPSLGMRQWWRPAAAAFLGVPLAVWLRGAWLNEAIPPIFVLVMVATVAGLMTVWRGAWMLLKRKRVGYG